jgi:polyether ionophore transport system permease protein
VTSQLGRTRRMANGLAMAAFGVTFVIRMIADSGPGTHWLRWATPFGWAELVRPFTEDDPWPLVPALLTVLVLGLGAVVLSRRRDAGDGLLAGRDVAAPRDAGLRSVFGLAARLDLPVLAGWCVGAAATAFVLGIIAKLTTADVPESLGDALDKFGIQGSFSRQYLGLAFLFVVTVVALIPASEVAAARDEETTGRLVHILSRPTNRAAWFTSRLVLAAGAIVVASAGAGLAAWVGAVSQGVDVSLSTMFVAAVNGIPLALVSLGVGAVVLAVAPRAAAAAVYGVVTWSFVVDLFASLYSSLDALQPLSLFHYMALAPAEDPDPVTLTVMVGLGVALCVVATVIFGRRDLRTT